MTSVIKIKRSTGTAKPTTLAAGELAYSFGTGTQGNSGDRLFFGNGTTVETIGGKYFTDMLDHEAGILTASSALVVNSLSKLDNLKVDNLDFNGSAITSLDADTNITITPNGTGKTVISNIYVGDTATSLQEYIEDIAGVTIVGGLGLTSTYSDEANQTTLSVNVDDSSIQITGDSLNVKALGIATGMLADGSVTNAKLAGSIANDKLTNSSITVGSTAISLGGSSTTLAGLTSVTVNNLVLSGNTITSTGNLVVNVSSDVIDFSGAALTNIALPLSTDTTHAASVSYVNSAVANASSATILQVAGNDLATVDVNLAADDLNFKVGTNAGLSITAAKPGDPAGTEVNITFALDQDLSTAGAVSFASVTTSGDVAVNGGDITTTALTASVFNTGATTLNIGGAATAVNIGAASTSLTTINNDLTVAGNLVVNGSTVTVNVETLTVEDPLISLAGGNGANILDIGFIGAYNDGAAKTTGFFRDASDGVYKLFATGSVAANVVTVTALADLEVGNLTATIDGGTY